MANPFVGPAIRCAGPGCEHARGEVNHWFAIWISPLAFHCRPLDRKPLEDEEMPVCGAACAQKIFEKYLSK